MKKKFDLIIMNPPYQRNLHLKILKNTIIQLKNKNSLCLNLSPYFLKNTEIDILKSIKQFLVKKMIYTEKITAEQADILFGIYSTCDLAISIFGINNVNKFLCPSEDINHIIISKLRNKKIAKSIRTMIWKTDGEFEISIQGDYGYVKRWKYTLEQMLSGNPNAKIKFKTKIEAERFKDYTCNRNIYKFIWLKDNKAAIPAHLPFLGNIINPRTKQIGYNSEWTDEDLYIVFNITKEEQKIIEETIKKCK